MGYDVKVEDIEYLRHGNTPYLATIYRPQGTGPFPIMVELHGGAWCRSDRHGDKVIHEALAVGVIVATSTGGSRRRRLSRVVPDIHYGFAHQVAPSSSAGVRHGRLDGHRAAVTG